MLIDVDTSTVVARIPLHSGALLHRCENTLFHRATFTLKVETGLTGQLTGQFIARRKSVFSQPFTHTEMQATLASQSLNPKHAQDSTLNPKP